MVASIVLQKILILSLLDLHADFVQAPSDRELVKAGKILGIEILDHLVIAQNSHISLKERGLGFFEEQY